LKVKQEMKVIVRIDLEGVDAECYISNVILAT